MSDNATTGVHVLAAQIVDLTAADLDTDATMAANSDSRVASQKATKTALATTVSLEPAAAQTISGGHQLINSGGFKGDMQETAPAAKTISAAIAEKQGLVRLGSGGALSMTLADPVSGDDDGKRLTIMASTAHAHIIFVNGGLAGGANNRIDLGGAIGDMVELEAIAGKWFPRPSINAALSID